RDGDYAPLEVIATPRSAEVRVSAFPDEVFSSPVTVWVPWGTHALTVSAPGFDPQEVTVAASGHDPVRRRVDLVATPPPEPEPDVVEAAPDAVGGDTLAPPDTADTVASVVVATARPDEGPSVAGIAFVSVAGAALVGGVVMYAIASGTRDDAAKLPPGDDFDRELGTFHTQRGLAYGLLIGAAVSGAVGAWLLATSGGDDAPGGDASAGPTLRVAPLPGGAAVGVTF
ncbi:MAG: hypothetical protein KC635_08085, partial [Myxococcales bacterium]|nr:hypothetical protein [Myxococcales bacterium]